LPPGCDLPDITRAFESKGVALEGAFGSSPKGMISFLKRQNCDMTIKKPGKDLDPGSLSGKPFIFTAFNDRNNIHSQLHTMAATPEAGGRIVLHNSFETKTGSSVYEDPADVLMNYRKGMGRTVCVIC
ncbi:MAG: hypothetical protein K6E33_05050, partial [Lachnospiraceae bacterium]|nr:hypothetical protein [Lachnospiraceae bacterium]